MVVIFSLVYLLTQRQCEDWRRRIGWSASMLDDEAREREDIRWGTRTRT